MAPHEESHDHQRRVLIDHLAVYYHDRFTAEDVVRSFGAADAVLAAVCAKFDRSCWGHAEFIGAVFAAKHSLGVPQTEFLVALSRVDYLPGDGAILEVVSDQLVGTSADVAAEALRYWELLTYGGWTEYSGFVPALTAVPRAELPAADRAAFDAAWEELPDLSPGTADAIAEWLYTDSQVGTPADAANFIRRFRDLGLFGYSVARVWLAQQGRRHRARDVMPSIERAVGLVAGDERAIRYAAALAEDATNTSFAVLMERARLLAAGEDL